MHARSVRYERADGVSWAHLADLEILQSDLALRLKVLAPVERRVGRHKLLNLLLIVVITILLLDALADGNTANWHFTMA